MVNHNGRKRADPLRDDGRLAPAKHPRGLLLDQVNRPFGLFALQVVLNGLRQQIIGLEPAGRTTVQGGDHLRMPLF